MDFNPRSHEGSDIANLCPLFWICFISIHAPTRGATEYTGRAACSCEHFNPRSHEGSDYGCFNACTLVCGFQSTLPRGERRAKQDSHRAVHDFNPRSHEGSDNIHWAGNCFRRNFNPRSHEGSDFCCLAVSGSNIKFQSTLPRGERQQFSPKSSLFSQQKLSKIFNLNNKLF